MSELSELLDTWELHMNRTRREQQADQAVVTGADPQPEELLVRALPDKGTTSLGALRANAQLVELLTSARWEAILDALEADIDWDEIAKALGTARGTVWSLFCAQTDALEPGSTAAARARAIKDPLRGRPPSS